MSVERMNLSLNGCGYLGIYHVGVCSCIKKYQPQILKNVISGGSVGALVACAFMCDVPLEICTRYVFDVSMKVRSGILGPMTPDLNIMSVLYERMDDMLPDDAHLRCDGKLHISVTRYDNGKNVLLKNFSSREELLQALMCSCFIPVYCGYEPPLFHGVAYVDAALSNNSPWLNEDTITVAPFSGNSDICPENDGMLLASFRLSNTSIGLTAKNAYMLFRVLFPGSPDIQKEFCQKGYNDAFRFLRDKGLVACTNCLADKSLKPINHTKCFISEHPMPKEISNEIESAIEKFKKNLAYRLLQYKSMKVLYYVNMPSIVTAKVTYVLLSAILQKVQNTAGSCVDDLWSNFLHILKEIISRTNASKKILRQVECKSNCNLVNYDTSKSSSTTSTSIRTTTSLNNNKTFSSIISNGEIKHESENANEIYENVKINVPENVQSPTYACKNYILQPNKNKAKQSAFSITENQEQINMSDVFNRYIY